MDWRKSCLVFGFMINLVQGNGHEGRYFAFSFPQTFGTTGRCEFVVTSSQDAMITVTAPAGRINDVNVLLPGGSSLRYTLPWAARSGAGKHSGKAVFVTSDVKVKVEALTMDTYGNGDGFLVLPVQEDGKEFMAIGHFGHASHHFMVLVTATQPDTRIQIYRREESGYKMVRSDTLMLGQVYGYFEKRDLSGLIVRSDKPVTVVNSLQATTRLPETSAHSHNPATMALPAVGDLGYFHLVPPIAGRERFTGYFVQIVAAHDNTQVTWVSSGGNVVSHLKRGEKKIVDIHSPIPVRVDCSKPCLVVLYNRGGISDGVKTDIFMMPVPSIGHFLNYALFNTFTTNTGEQFQYYLSIIAKSPDIAPEFLLDNEKMVLSWECVGAGYSCDYVFSNVTMRHNDIHELKPRHPSVQFLAWSYGHAPSGKSGVAYGLLTAMKSLNLDIEIENASRQRPGI